MTDLILASSEDGLKEIERLDHHLKYTGKKPRMDA